MARHDSELTDEQWRKIEPLLPKIKRSGPQTYCLVLCFTWWDLGLASE